MPRSHLRGRGCILCTNITEGKLFNILKNIYTDIKFNVNFDWCKNLPFDFCIESKKIIIEIDGEQHFNYIPHFHRNGLEDLNKQFDKDCFKMKQANKNGFSVIRLLQKNVMNDTNNWKILLNKHIKKYDNPTNIYISNGNEYNKLKYKVNNLE